MVWKRNYTVLYIVITLFLFSAFEPLAEGYDSTTTAADCHTIYESYQIRAKQVEGTMAWYDVMKESYIETGICFKQVSDNIDKAFKEKRIKEQIEVERKATAKKLLEDNNLYDISHGLAKKMGGKVHKNPITKKIFQTSMDEVGKIHKKILMDLDKSLKQLTKFNANSSNLNSPTRNYTPKSYNSTGSDSSATFDDETFSNIYPEYSTVSPDTSNSISDSYDSSTANPYSYPTYRIK